MTDIVSEVIALILIIWAAFEDVKAFKIPNYLIVTGFANGGVILAVRYIMGKNIEDYILGFIAGLLGMMILYILKAVGAGDVKLLAVIGLLIGKTLVIKLTLVSLLAGAMIGIIELCVKKTRLMELGGYKLKVHGFHYAVAVAAAYIVVLGYRIVVEV